MIVFGALLLAIGVLLLQARASLLTIEGFCLQRDYMSEQ